MRNTFIVVFIISFLLVGCLKSFSQFAAIADKAYDKRVYNMNSIEAGFDLLFYLSDEEMDDHVDLRLANAAQFSYIVTSWDVELNLRQTLERKSSGSIYFNNYMMFSAGILKYKPIDDKRTSIRKYYAEPLFIIQNNSDRGLERRFQVGALFHPWSLIKNKVRLNIGIGAVYDWSSWEVNDTDMIADVSQDLREKIEFVNSHITMRNNMYQDHAELRPMVLANLYYQVNDYVGVDFGISYQQSIKSPYSQEIRDVYPDLGKVHPYILSKLDVNIKLHKGFSLKLSAILDYDNSNLSLYKSSWMYSVLFGAAWTFSNQKK